jgi:Ca2+-binding RTX toxin-like protein
MRRTLVLGSAVLALAIPSAAQAAPVTVFSDDFSGATKPEWSGAVGNITTPSPANATVLGETNGEPLSDFSGTLTLAALPAHQTFTLSYDLYALHSLDGNGESCCPEKWDVDATGVASDIQPETSFTNGAGTTQCYPQNCPASNTFQTGAEETGDLLGYGNYVGTAARYRIEYTAIPHTDGTLTFTFKDRLSQGWIDEGWALDNVVVTVDSAGPACTKTGTVGNDSLVGTSGDDVLCGLGGDDKLDGRGGNDVLLGAEGNDRLIAGAGDDTMDGGDGIDTANYTTHPRGVSVDLNIANANDGVNMDYLPNIEYVTGSEFGDTIYAIPDDSVNVFEGRGGNDVLDGFGGNDTLVGNGGNDTLIGGAGRDLLVPGSGDDFVGGDDGVDRVDYTSVAGFGIFADLVAGFVWPVNGSDSGMDGVYNVEEIVGTRFTDFLAAKDPATKHVLIGGLGDDTLQTNDGDRLDAIFGGDGADSCSADARDTLSSC